MLGYTVLRIIYTDYSLCIPQWHSIRFGCGRCGHKTGFAKRKQYPFTSIFRDSGFESADYRGQRTFLRGNRFLFRIICRDVACNVSVWIIGGIDDDNKMDVIGHDHKNWNFCIMIMTGDLL